MKSTRPGDQRLVREINLSSVLSYLHTEAPLSRSQLASLTGLNKSTISSLIEELIERGLVYEVGLDSSGAGRPATSLELNPGAGLIVGVELGVDFISVILTDFLGNIEWRCRHETDPTMEQETIVADALNLVGQAMSANRSPSRRLLGVGLALPGLVDIQEGILTFSPNLQWRNVPLGKIFSDYTGAPVYVDNDANASAVGEHLFGIARKSEHFIFVIAGVGVGAGLFLNGDLYRGAGGFAGEIGHTTLVNGQNRPCRCGNRGCWENFANQYALIERVRARLDVGRRSLISQMMGAQNGLLTISVINQAASAGDAEALEALNETGAMIGLELANLVNIFNPQLVVIGGSLSLGGEHMLPAIQSAVAEHTFPESRRDLEIAISAFGTDASVMGAVALVVKSILSNPTRVARRLS
ncbi:MAG: ROK family transcriptional regulator [Anaerolineales bacterium]|nr:ROK family transcriptional regulator [Anaerolineales bacterium]